MIYYSQQDPRWKDEVMGVGPYKLGGPLGKGCTTADICTGGSWFNDTIDPRQAARQLEYTKPGHPLGPGLILWQSIGKVFKHMEFDWRFYGHDEVRIKNGLKNPNTVVLLQVDRGAHWVFALSKIPLLGYRSVDPWQYPAKVRYYKPSEVVGGAVLRRK